MISIQGIRVKSLSIKNGEKVSGTYELVSTADKVLATQAFNQYGELDVSLSPATQKALDQLLAAIKSDLNIILGLEGSAT